MNKPLISKFEDVACLGNHADCANKAKQTIHLQACTKMLCNANQNTTQCTLPFVKGNYMVSSSVSLEIFTEMQLAERSNHVTVSERQLD